MQHLLVFFISRPSLSFLNYKMEMLSVYRLRELKLSEISFVKCLVYNGYTREVFSLPVLYFGPKRVRVESSSSDGSMQTSFQDGGFSLASQLPMEESSKCQRVNFRDRSCIL